MANPKVIQNQTYSKKMHKFRRIFQGLAAKSITMPVNSVEEVPTFPRSPLGGSIGPTSTLGETIEVF